MSGAAMYATLRRLSVPVVTTEEAAAALRTSRSAASRGLRSLATKGLVRRIRHGLWAVTAEPLDPRAIVSELTRPFPAYVSFRSALAARGAIDQVPREISVASLAKPRRVETALATYEIHRVPPELFGGFEDSGGVALATVEKAIFDYLYVACASGHSDVRLPELDLPAAFSLNKLRRWVQRIHAPRLRTRVATAVARALEHAEYEDARAPLGVARRANTRRMAGGARRTGARRAVAGVG